MNNFRLNDFMNGAEVKTRSGRKAEFICLLPKETPARLLVDIWGAMENYYLDGSVHNNSFEHKDDLQMSTHFDK